MSSNSAADEPVRSQRHIPARGAYAANMVSELVPPGGALARALALGEKIAAMSPLAVRAIRDVVRLGADVPLDTALALERRYFERLFDSEDQKEGMRAFFGEAQARLPGLLASYFSLPRRSAAASASRHEPH